MKIAVITYGTAQLFKSRKQATRFFKLAMLGCEGAERDRYSNVYFSLEAGETWRIKDREDLPPFVVDDPRELRLMKERGQFDLAKCLEASKAVYGTGRDFWNKETA